MLPVTGNQLIHFIPQKPPFVLISSLVEINEQTCTTKFSFDSSHVLCSNGKLSAAGLIENMAQTSGCKAGYAGFLKGAKPTLGYIGEVRNFTYSRLPNAGEELTTQVTIDNEIFGVIMISGKVSTGGEEIASCKMKVFLAPDESGQPANQPHQPA